MSGRSYTMKELKGIVEYIKEREAYGETKGRKMWVDFANSGSTTRTWQSLKETFLKRILPDIHNPYYRLTSDELRSFRAGSNFTKFNRKLEVHSSVLPEVPDHTDRGTKTKKANPNCNGDVGNATGEEPNIKNTDVRRDSVETVILDSNQPAYHYDSTQDIIKDLESTNDEEPVHPPSSAKSIRDVFTYSEPLTPMIQEIFHDFETDDSNTFDNNSSDHNKHSSGNVQDTCNQDNKPAPKDISGNKYDSESDKSKKIKLLRKGSKKSHKIQKPAQNMRIERTLENVKSIVDENRKLKQVAAEKINLTSLDQNDKIQPENLDGLKQVTSLTTEKSEDCHNSGLTDSSIPNNQEASNKNRCVKETETLEQSKEPDVSETIKSTTVETKSNESSNYSEDKIPKKNSDTKDESKGKIEKGKFINQTKNDNSTTTEEKQVPGTENDNSQINGKQYVEPVVNIVHNNKSASDKLNSQEKTYINEEESDMIKKTCDQIVSESDKNISITRSQVDNPCLKSESLYLGGKDKPNVTQNNNRFPSENNVVLLDSHSGSDSSNSFITTPHKRTQENSKVLAKMFGFSNGAGNHKQETRIVSSTISDANDYTESMSSDSSRWTSDDEIEFVASPRKSRCSRKYLNPGSCKIVPLDHEGGLLVAYKGKVYPLIKEERSVKGRELKYMAYAPNKNAEDGASYWRKKYFQEKKKAQELSSKLMNKKRSSKLIRKSTSVESKESDQNVPQIPDHAIVNRMEQDIEKVVLRKEEQTDDNKDNKAIKIKIHSDNKEVAIEGQWQNMASILPNIMQLFDKEPQAKLDHYNSHDDDVKEKVSKIEEEIFKEIEEIDKTSPGNDRKSVSSTNSVPDVMILNTVTAPTEEDFVDNVKSVQKPEVENFTNRRKRRRSRRDLEQIRTENISQSPVKKRASRRLISESENEIIVNEEKLQLVEDIAEMNRKPIPSKHTNVPRNRALRKKLLSISSDDSTVGYKFPSPERKALEVPNNKKGPLRTPKKGKKTYDSKNSTKTSFMFLNESSQKSTESSYGYQDSDCSPRLILQRRKINFPAYKKKLRLEARRKSSRRHKFRCYSSTSKSDFSSFSISLRKSSDSSLSTAMYQTDSYQLLWAKKENPPFKASLQKIMEVTPPLDEFTKELSTLNLSPAPPETTEIGSKFNAIHQNDSSKDTSKTKTDIGNSSNISLPPSPELSIVEKIAIERSDTTRVDVPLILNELQSNTIQNDISHHVSIVSKEIDLSGPLMDQEFNFITSHTQERLDGGNDDIGKRENYTTADMNTVHMKTIQSPHLATTVSDSLINEMKTVNINDDSDTLNQRLSDLIVMSAEKSEKRKGKSKKYDDRKILTLASGSFEKQEKYKSRKRCSTPHKRTTKKKSVPATVEAIIEERMEYCTTKTRKSCPPSIFLNNQQIDIEDTIPVDVDRSTRKRRHKEIIRVKILKPKKRYEASSARSDSGIHDSEIGVLESALNDNVDLIHNHSDTCLDTRDCLENSSVVINENSSEGVISLTSDTSQASNETKVDDFQENRKQGVISDLLSTDAQYVKTRDIQLFPKAIQKTITTNNEKVPSVMNSPLSYNSLITEDMSDERPTSRESEWYLLSEDDCTSTNVETVKKSNYGSYLEKLFPVACAVPDLSTITEASREADILKEAKGN